MDPLWLLLLPSSLVGAQVALHVWFRLHMGSRAPGIWAVTRVQLHETLAWGRVGLWHGTWDWKHEQAPDVLAIHGYTQNPSNWRGLQQRLASDGRRVRGVFLGFAWPWRRVEGYAAPLERALEELAAEARQVDVVVHSMGGLVLRELLHRRPDLRPVVGRVVTMGTPHGGTAAARWGLVHPLGQLRHGSGWLARLPALSELLPAERVATIGSTMDLIVYPASTTRQPGAEHREFDHVGHAGLLTDDRVLQTAVELLRGPGTTEPKGL